MSHPQTTSEIPMQLRIVLHPDSTPSNSSEFVKLTGREMLKRGGGMRWAREVEGCKWRKVVGMKVGMIVGRVEVAASKSRHARIRMLLM